ncbi:sporulation protein [Lujinxingia litoralis]|uniref:sporulation protein n=1 Tax=Lujinxingia litoralis TaxID=2211119 RepID=UPI0013149E7B|nr:sporulation protein [Lujinxingia litoralis]
MAKIKLSETLRFLGTRLNKITGSDLEFLLEVEEAQVRPGAVIHAQARVRSPESGERELTHVAISLRGQVQREGKWQDYDQRAEVAHNTALPGGHEFVIPIEVQIPEDAVLSEDGATWSLRAQAVVDRSVDPRAEALFEVIGG